MISGKASRTPSRVGRQVLPSHSVAANASWRELGRSALNEGWARRFVFDVAHGKLALPPQSALPALSEIALGRPEVILGALRRGDPIFALSAGTALGRPDCGLHDALALLAQSPEVTPRLAAVAGLAAEASFGSVTAVQELGQRAGDPSGEVRHAAIVALGQARGRAASEQALRCLEQAASSDERSLAAAAFGAVALYPAARGRSESLLMRISGSGPAARRAVAAAIRGLPRATAARVAKQLLSDSDAQVRAMALRAAAPPASNGRAVARRAAAEKNPTVRAAYLSMLPSESVVCAVETLARDNSAVVRAALAESLACSHHPTAVRTLHSLAGDSATAVRAAAVRSLGGRGVDDVVLAAALDTDPSVRAAAAEALDPSGAHALGALISLSRDRDYTVARAAARSLCRHCFSLNGSAAQRVTALLADEFTAPAAAEGLAAAFDTHPEALREAVNGVISGTTFPGLLPAEAIRPELLWTIARSARTPEVADLARSAARALELTGDLAEALSDLALAVDWLGLPEAAALCAWLAECADAASLQSIAELAAAPPRVDSEPVSFLLAAARSVASAVRVSSTEARSRHLSRASAALEICAQRCEAAVCWRPLASIAAAWTTILGPPERTLAKAVKPTNRIEGRLLRSAAPTVTPPPSTLPNPYVVGKPLAADSAMFFGRKSDLKCVERALRSGDSGAVVVLAGQRRTGKTSVLRRLESLLRASYWCHPVFVDIQGMLVGDTDALFRQLARQSLSAAGLPDAPVNGSGAQIMHEVAESLDRRLVLLLDEFDDLEQKVRTGLLTPQIFPQLRHLIQHSANVGLVLCGTHRLEALAGEHWSFLLNLASHHRIGLLDADSAQEVIQVPLARLGIGCGEPALQRAITLAGRHPYFLQLLGYRVVEDCIESGSEAVDIDSVERAAEQVVQQGAIHLRYLWEIASASGQPVLQALSRAPGSLSLDELRRAADLSSARLRRILRELIDAELVQETAGRYAVEIGLLSRWITHGELR